MYQITRFVNDVKVCEGLKREREREREREGSMTGKSVKGRPKNVNKKLVQ